MTWEHDRVEELLAGHALGGLDGEDAALAERALEEHVPTCERCRRAWDDYREVAADLALAAPAEAPSDLLDARIRRAVSPRRSLRPVSAASIAAGVALLAFSVFSTIRAGQLDDRLARATQTQNSLFGVVSTVADPDHEAIALEGEGDAGAWLYYVPGERAYLMAADLPPAKHQYHVWFMEDGRTWHAGVLRVIGGRAVLPCKTDPRRWDAVMLTDEPGRPTPESSPLVSATVSAD